MYNGYMTNTHEIQWNRHKMTGNHYAVNAYGVPVRLMRIPKKGWTIVAGGTITSAGNVITGGVVLVTRVSSLAKAKAIAAHI